jgi:RHS repeat-associated protein
VPQFSYTGTSQPNPFWSDWVQGDRLRVKLMADSSVTYYGFDLTEIEADFKPAYGQGGSDGSTPHPYNNCGSGTCMVWTSNYLGPFTGAVRVRAKLDKLETEACCDKVKVFDTNGNQVLPEYSGPLGVNNGGIWTHWVSGNRIKVELWADTSVTYYGFDITAVEVDYGTTYSLNARLPGQWAESENGLLYNWHRHYDPKIGRYLGFDRWTPITPYAYAKSNPLAVLDTDGRRPLRFEEPATTLDLPWVTTSSVLSDVGSRLRQRSHLIVFCIPFPVPYDMPYPVEDPWNYPGIICPNEPPPRLPTSEDAYSGVPSGCRGRRPDDCPRPGDGDVVTCEEGCAALGRACEQRILESCYGACANDPNPAVCLDRCFAIGQIACQSAVDLCVEEKCR